MKYAEITVVELGTAGCIEALKEELAGVTEALSRALPRRQREELLEMQMTKSAELIKLEKLLERAVHVSAHHFLRAYDAVRSICSGGESVRKRP